MHDNVDSVLAAAFAAASEVHRDPLPHAPPARAAARYYDDVDVAAPSAVDVDVINTLPPRVVFPPAHRFIRRRRVSGSHLPPRPS